MDVAARAQLLGQVAFFGELDEQTLQRLAARATLTTFPAGQVVIREGEIGQRVFVLAKGHVGIYRAGSDGTENVITYLSPPEVVGELSLFDDSPRSASVKALELTEALVIDKKDFRDFLAENPPASFGICSVLTRRIREGTDLINALASQQAREVDVEAVGAAAMPGGATPTSSRAEDEALGLHLVSEGLLTRAQMILGMNRAIDAGTPLAQMLIRMKAVDPSALSAAEGRFRRMRKVRPADPGPLIRSLMTAGFLDPDQMRRLEGRDVDTVLHALKEEEGLSDEDILNVLEHGGARFRRVDPADYDVVAAALVPPALMEEHRVFPLERTDNVLRLGMVAPEDTYAQEIVGVATGLEIEPWLLLSANFHALWTAFQEGAKSGRGQRSRATVEIIRDLTGILKRSKEDTSSEGALPLLDGILRSAIRSRASDIHIEPQESRTRVRFRIDGILQDVVTVPTDTHARIVGAVKVAANMDIANRLIPHDGKAVFDAADGRYVIRVSTLPAMHGEKIVMRLHKDSDVMLGLRDLGLTEKQFHQVERLSKAPYGMVLVTGPVGSGKTTSLYSVLHSIDVLRTNVVTIEDPVEYELPGVNHVEVNPKSGMTYVTGLKSILRQDPDVIMLGEIRDHDSAQIATRAACTGVLMLTTLHTNDAPSAVTALLHMGVEPFFIVNALLGVVAQRLVRIVCDKCAESYVPDGALIASYGLDEKKTYHFKRSVGCAACGHTGYRGRIGIFEIMRSSPAIRDMVLRGEPEAVVRRKAIEEGMITLRQAAVIKVVEGRTTAEEVARKTAEDEATA